MNDIRFFATCPKGIENLLNQELIGLGSSEVRETVAGVYFTGDIQLAYRACLWSRLANKILLPLGKGPVQSADQLYQLVKQVAWEQHLPEQGTLLVDFLGTNKAIRHTQFGAQTVKDAVVDRVRELRGARPDVNKLNPDLRINVRLAKGLAHISLDISGESLHKRGYRLGLTGAPLKENLAAAILLRADWPQIAENQGALLDPMCGSGTFLVEAAMMATEMAPGLLRARQNNFAFVRWQKHQPEVWQQLLDDAEARFKRASEKQIPEIRGYDNDPRALGNARKNITASGMDDFIRVSLKSIEEFKKPTHTELNHGLMLCNPPYGERLGEIEALKHTYASLGAIAKTELPGWQLGVFTGNKELANAIGLWARKKYQLFNGAIASELLLYTLREEGEIRTTVMSKAEPEAELPRQQRTLNEGAQMVYNRLQKNRKKLEKWRKQSETPCYRVYDADMPEYSAAVDVYQSLEGQTYLHIQEYAAPKSVDAQKARERFDQLLTACAHSFKLADSCLVSKRRVINKGKQQYEKNQQVGQSETFSVAEGKAVLEINLHDYLDTGLFLDHRPLRTKIASEAQGKTFLNLYCYTASATVQAALAGATSSVSVDMSNTYLEWGARNFQLNAINPNKHQLVRADCFEWLKQCRQGFDLIMLDPPSFSNSKKMQGVLDVQKDQLRLVTRCMEILNPGGVLYFSNNLRSFKLDAEIEKRFKVNNISAQTLDADFKGNPKIHQCWRIEAI